MNDALRDEVLENFAIMTKLPPIRALVQRGRDPQNARFTLVFDDDTKVKIGDADALYSQTKLNRILAVANGTPIRATKPGEYRTAIDALISHATTVQETPDEALSDRIADWLDQYARSATTDREGAAPAREPFTDDDMLYVHAEHLARWIKRDYSEPVAAGELRAALTDLGFEAVRVDYTAAGRGKTRRRTTARYYRCTLKQLDGDRG